MHRLTLLVAARVRHRGAVVQAAATVSRALWVTEDVVKILAALFEVLEVVAAGAAVKAAPRISRQTERSS